MGDLSVAVTGQKAESAIILTAQVKNPEPLNSISALMSKFENNDSKQGRERETKKKASPSHIVIIIITVITM